MIFPNPKSLEISLQKVQQFYNYESFSSFKTMKNLILYQI